MGCCYLVFQNHNAAIDSWYYAACVKHGEELLNSHHLLYNVIGRGWYNLLTLFDPTCQAINALNAMNAIAGTACLFVLFAILKRMGTEITAAFILTLMAGACFGFIRFTTDAETYILPLLLSLASTYYLAKGLSNRHVLASAILAAFAILIHELHVWWGVAGFVFLCLTGPFNWRLIVCYTIPFLLVPAVYLLAYQSLGANEYSFTQFILGEYGKHNASIAISLPGLVLTIVNAIRSFVQLHGQIAFFFKHYAFYLIIPCAIVIGFGINFCIALRKNGIGVKHATPQPYSKLFLMAFVFHLLFAFLSSGNAEFMVMFPFLAMLYISTRYSHFNLKALKYLFCVIFIWNLTVGVIPHSLLNIERVDKQVEFQSKHTSSAFLWTNKPLVENVMTYQKGFNYHNHYIKPSPDAVNTIDSLLDKGQRIYTDMTDNKTGINRKTIMSTFDLKEILKPYQLLPVDSFNNIYGKNYISEIVKKAN